MQTGFKILKTIYYLYSYIIFYTPTQVITKLSMTQYYLCLNVLDTQSMFTKHF